PDEMAIQRYDAATDEWETLETTVEEAEGGATLVVEVNEFSVFAVTERPTTATATTAASTRTPTATPTPTGTATATPVATPTPTGTATASTATPAPAESGTTEGDSAGFGAALAVGALLLAGLLIAGRE
ncbi:MAG: hypothetical protein ABEH40_07570, partial [Haloferacaceae archaeon]